MSAFTVNTLYDISHFDMHAPTVSLSRLNIETAYKYPIGAPEATRLFLKNIEERKHTNVDYFQLCHVDKLTGPVVS